MSGWQSSRPPWETQDQPRQPDEPRLQAEDAWYGTPQGPRVIIKAHEGQARGGRSQRHAIPSGGGSRGRALAGVVVCLAAAGGLTVGAVQLTHLHGSPAPVAALGPASATQSAPPAPSPATAPAALSGSSPSATTGSTPSWVLSAPPTAGGYTLTSPMSATIAATGSAGASQLMSAVEAGGGKAAGSVTGEYLISGDQALGYAGYDGTFSPAAVMQVFQAGASSVATEAAGPHGGTLACGTVTANGTSGTACVWATTTTLGMVEFFGGTALEPVQPAKAGADALKFRDDVESAKGT